MLINRRQLLIGTAALIAATKLSPPFVIADDATVRAIPMDVVTLPDGTKWLDSFWFAPNNPALEGAVQFEVKRLGAEHALFSIGIHPRAYFRWDASLKSRISFATSPIILEATPDPGDGARLDVCYTDTNDRIWAEGFRWLHGKPVSLGRHPVYVEAEPSHEPRPALLT